MKTRTAYLVLILDKTAYHKCLFLSTCDQNLVKLRTQTKYDVETSKVTNNDGSKAQNHSKAQKESNEQWYKLNKLSRNSTSQHRS